jgi:hypothetical protein
MRVTGAMVDLAPGMSSTPHPLDSSALWVSFRTRYTRRRSWMDLFIDPELQTVIPPLAAVEHE